MNKIKPPKATKQARELTIHGHTRIDNYYWMNQRENPDVIKYLEDENAYTNAIMKDTEQLQDTLFNEIVGRIKKTDMSVPYFKNGYYYYSRYEDNKEYPFHCRKKGSLNAQEEILLDVNKLAAGHTYYQLGSMAVSPNNKTLAFSADTVGRRIYTIYFKNLDTGEIATETIANTTGGITWAADSKTIFFSVKDPVTLRSHQIYRYQTGLPNSKTLVFQEDDETFSAYVYKTRSKKYIVIGSSATLTDEYWVLDANNPLGEFKIFQPRVRGMEYSISHHGNKFFVLTNWNATNFKLMTTIEYATEIEHWKEYIPEKENVYIEGILAFKDYLMVHQREKGSQQIKVINLINNNEHNIDFGTSPYNAWFSQNPEYNTKVLRLGYTSMTIPSTIYDYNLETRELTMLKQQEVVGGYNANHYASERIYATAADGTEIPITISYKKGAQNNNGQAPLLLYGYGSYGITNDPYFSISRLSLLDRGFTFALAHIRGGQIMGRHWYNNGKMLNKMNTFTDFIACAEHLTNEEYTSANKIFAMGGSAGGLLMGAVMNLRPDLFHGIVASVPFVDVVTTMLDEDIPLTTGEYDEWGNPNEKEYYEYMLSYSPYDNVDAKNYPNILVTTGLHDSQVQYWEPAKWVAKLRELKTNDNLLLFKTNMEAGHSGASGRFQPYKEVALEYAFMLKLLNN